MDQNSDALRTLLNQMVEAIKKGAITSEEIYTGDDVYPYHFWHDEWRHYAEKALAIQPAASDAVGYVPEYLGTNLRTTQPDTRHARAYEVLRERMDYYALADYEHWQDGMDGGNKARAAIAQADAILKGEV